MNTWNLIDPDNKAVQVINKFAYGVLCSLLWALLCCTIVGFGPACAALYHTMVKVIRRNRGTVFHEFFGSMKKSWKVTIPAGLFAVLLIASLIWIDLPNITALFSGQAGSAWMPGLFSILKAFICISFILYAFPIFSRFEAGVIRGCVFSLILAFRHILATLAMFLITAGAVFLFTLQPLLIFFLPAAVVFVQSLMMEPILLRHMSEEDKTPGEGKDLWYLPGSEKEEEEEKADGPEG